MAQLNARRRRGKIARVVVTPGLRLSLSGTPICNGKLIFGTSTIPCAIGRSGSGWAKREGDGTTPKGTFRLVSGYFRADRLVRPKSQIAFRSMRMNDGWCDAPRHPAYNRPVCAPFKSSHEALWRRDSLYDIILVLDYNFSCRARGLGSAIFLHLWESEDSPTEGCVAIDFSSMRKLLPRLAKGAVIEIR